MEIHETSAIYIRVLALRFQEIKSIRYLFPNKASADSFSGKKRGSDSLKSEE